MMRDANSAIERAMMLHQGRNEDALKHYDRALALSPRYAMAHNNLGMSLLALGRNEEALTSFQRAVAIEPGYAEARWNAALIALVTGDFQTGWEMHEARWQINGRQPPWFAGLPPWNGEPVAGKTVLVYGEGVRRRGTAISSTSPAICRCWRRAWRSGWVKHHPFWPSAATCN